LLVPLIGAAIVLLPVTFVVWTTGWLMSGLCDFEDVRRLQFQPEIQSNLFGPAHLWFLEYLYLMCLVFGCFCALRSFAGRFRKTRMNVTTLLGDQASRVNSEWLDRSLASPWLPLLPAVPAAVIVACFPDAICGFRNTFVPELPRLAYYSVFFATGTLLARARHDLERFFIPRSGWLLAIWPLTVFFSGVWLKEFLDHGLSTYGRLALGASFALAASIGMFALIGLALRMCSREWPVLRYLADASYWIYLVHFPLTGFLQVLLDPLSLGAALKFSIVLSTAVGVGLVSYQRLVRFTFLGQFLNGSRPKPLAGVPVLRSRAA
jgi:peptidoglycan/LPS O-acetylase OafA/YrhL